MGLTRLLIMTLGPRLRVGLRPVVIVCGLEVVGDIFYAHHPVADPVPDTEQSLHGGHRQLVVAVIKQISPSAEDSLNIC